MIKETFARLHNYRSWAFSLDHSIEPTPVENKQASIPYFILSILFYILYRLCVEPRWFLGGEMWAEMGVNYFPNANAESYLVKFFSTDSGYIPVPQRLIGYVGNLLALKATSFPYFYTWSSTILTSMLIGVFCLPVFRKLVKSDLLRFVAVLAVLIAADFETRTFINFTYFATFFTSILTAFALTEDKEQVPAWAWFVPILMVSKPAVLVILPGMLVTSLVSKSRFRWITIVTTVLCLAQLIQMVASVNAGTMSTLQSQSAPLYTKLVASIAYFFGFLANYLGGPIFIVKKYILIFFGFIFFIAIVKRISKARTKSNSLIFVGASILFFNVFLNCFALSTEWTISLEKLESGILLYRHIIPAFFGCIMIVTGLISNYGETKNIDRRNMFYKNIEGIVFAAWFIFSGWIVFGVKISREPNSPILNNSHWKILASEIDLNTKIQCIPIDPLGWAYTKNCSILNPELNMVNWGQDYRLILKTNKEFKLEINPPSVVKDNLLVSFGIVVKPVNKQTRQIIAKALVTTKDGQHHELNGERFLPIRGGLLLMKAQTNANIKDVVSVDLTFNQSVDVRFTINETNLAPVILWMGNKQ